MYTDYIDELVNDGLLFGSVDIQEYDGGCRIVCGDKLNDSILEIAEYRISTDGTIHTMEFAMYVKTEYIDDDETDTIFRIDSVDHTITEVLEYIKNREGK